MDEVQAMSYGPRHKEHVYLNALLGSGTSKLTNICHDHKEGISPWSVTGGKSRSARPLGTAGIGSDLDLTLLANRTTASRRASQEAAQRGNCIRRRANTPTAGPKTGNGR